MVNFMELIKSFLVTPYFLGMILVGVFLGIYVLIDKIIKNPLIVKSSATKMFL